MAYATKDEFKAQGDNIPDLDDDTIIGLYIDAADLQINQFCNRPDGFVADAAASARVFAGQGRPWLWVGDFIDTDTLVVAVKDAATDTTYTTWETDEYIGFAGDYTRPNFHPESLAKPYTSIMISAVGDPPQSSFLSGAYNGQFVPTVQVTAKWGYAETVPATIKQCSLMQSYRWYKRFKAHFSDTLGNEMLGQLMYTKVFDPDIENILINGRYKRVSIGR